MILGQVNRQANGWACRHDKVQIRRQVCGTTEGEDESFT